MRRDLTTHSIIKVTDWAIIICIIFVCDSTDRTTVSSPFLLSYSVFIFIFSLFFVSGPCARLSWPSRQLLSAR